MFESEEWIDPYPPMNIARYSSTHIIVAGGNDCKGRTSSVEVLEVDQEDGTFLSHYLTHGQY